ncbi:MAG: hypothetical protein ACM3TT_10530 [Syntrophothermus sp.]
MEELVTRNGFYLRGTVGEVLARLRQMARHYQTVREYLEANLV